MTEERSTDPVVDLLSPDGTGPVWGMASSDLNATLLVWPPGHELIEHTNAERDVVLVVLEGTGVAVVDGHEQPFGAGELLLIPKGRSRSLRAGDRGVRYLSVHLRRGGLQIEGLR